MTVQIGPEQFEKLLAESGSLRKDLEKAGIFPPAPGESAPVERLQAVGDEELDAVTGGSQIPLDADGVNRNSWFVSLLSKLMAQDNGSPEVSPTGEQAQRLITIDGRTFRILRIGESGSYRYVLEVLP